MSFRLCIIIPVYNHGDAIAANIDHLADHELPLILINDNSDDNNTAILHRLAKGNDWIEVIDLPENQGKGGAVMTGLKAALSKGYSHAVQIDADGQHDFKDISLFAETAKENPEAVVVGQPRYDASIPKGRLIGRYITHVWIWIETLSLTIKDSMCGFRVYPLAITNKILSSARLGKRMDFDPEILVRMYWANIPIRSLKTKVVYPPNGLSHFRMWEDNWLISCMHTRLFFGMLLRSPRLLIRKLR